MRSGSPAIDSGNSGVPNWPATDAEGRPRVDDPGTHNSGSGPIPYADRGALEFGAPGPDRAPVVSAPASVGALEGSRITVRVTASDFDGDAIASLSADLSELPAGNNASFNTNSQHTSGTLTWTPTSNDARGTPYHVQFTASNALSGFTLTAITVTNVQHAPVVVAPADVNGTTGTPLVVQVTASDPDGDPITSLSADLSKLPRGNTAVFATDPNHTSGTLTWTPERRDNHKYKVTFTAANGRSDMATTNIRIRRALTVLAQEAGDEPEAPATEPGAAARPASLRLSSAYPNPSASGVSFTLELPENLPVAWAVRDLQGRTLWSEAREQRAGRMTLAWSGTTRSGERVPPGLYFMRLVVGREALVRRFVLMRR